MRRRKPRPSLLLLLGALFGASAASAAGTARVEQFSPEGSVKAPRQVTARFSEPMVRLGDPRAPAPFDVDCSAAGSGRWIDPRNWVFDFEADVPGGVVCRFAGKSDLRTVSGASVEQATFVFDTGGPAARATLPAEGDAAIDENAVFVLAPDALVDLETVRERARCEVSGIGEAIPVDVLDEAERRDVLSERRRLGYPYARLLSRGRSDVEPLAPAQAEAAERDLVVLRCRRALPPDAEVRLVWGAGIATPAGVATRTDQTLVFRTRPEFTARFECRRVDARAPCLPGAAMRLVFSAPVARDRLAAATLEGADGAVAAVLDEGDFVEQIRFPAPFPPRARFRVVLPGDLVDDAGRALANAGAFPLDVATDDFPPLAKFAGEFGILESREGGVLPVSLRRVDDVTARRLPAASTIPGRRARIDDDAEIVDYLERVRAAMAPRGEWARDTAGESRWRERTGSESVLEAVAEAEPFELPRADDADAGDFQVVGIALGEPGFHVVELASPRLGAALLGEGAGPRYVATTVLVTNLAVHLEWGRESSLVWVTTLDEAKPVAGADVRVAEYCSGRLLWRGVTDESGVARVVDARSSPLPEPHAHAGCADWHSSPLFVSARAEGELGFTVSSWADGISPAAFGLPEGGWQRPDLVHTVLDRTLLRAGETVSMKHVLRRRTSDGFAVPPRSDAKLVLRHDGSGQTIESELRFDARGIAESAWAIPPDAKLGRYQIEVRFGEGVDARSFWSGDFRVETFRVPSMRAVVQAPAAPLIAPDAATLDLFLEYLSGGPASGAPVRLRSLVTERTVVHPKYAAFTFGGEDVEAGTRTEDAGAWFFPAAEPATAGTTARVTPVVLDAGGAARVTIPDMPTIATAHNLVVEMEYADANGEIATVARRIPLSPAGLELGLRTEGWVGSRTALRFDVLALDLEGVPAPDRDVRVELYARKTHSYRKRLVGGYYSYAHRTVTEPLDVECRGRTSPVGLLTCEVEPGVSGEVVLRAVARDDAGRDATATRSMWVAGEDEWWFAAADGDRMDVLPERDAYEAGDTARLQVRMPFRSATALVTVAREGVLEHFVTELSGSEPVVEVPIAPRFAPNVYVSVLAVRGRVGTFQSWLADLVREWDLPFRLDGGAPTTRLDLSKPAYRLGVARLDVGFAPHRLDVAVTPAATSYKVRDTARVRVDVARADGRALPAEAEFAFAAVDEGLLELAPNTSWQLLEAMMGRRGIEVYTSTAQMQVVGKRHYGRKAVPVGGGGGHDGARELFDTLLLWRGRVPLDASGSAELDVPLVDSLTSYRLVAVAQAGDGLFGTGSAEIRTTQDVILHAGLPVAVREGDRFDAAFTVRNAGERAVTVRAGGDTTSGGDTMSGGGSTALPEQTIELAAGAAQVVVWPTEVPAAVDAIEWNVWVRDGEATLDRGRVVQPVAPAVPVRVLQATLEQVGATPLAVPVERPADALPGGGLEVRLASRLGGALDGVRRHMARYPYACLEQRVSQAVALRDEARWRTEMERLPGYLDRDGLLRFFPAEWLAGEDVLTAYVLAIADEAGWNIPDDSRDRMLDALTGFVEGRVTRESALETPDLTVRRLAALSALARYGRAGPHHVGSFAVEPPLWPTAALLDWREIVERVDGIPEREARRREADALLRARLDIGGTRLGFADDDALWWLLGSGDVDANRLLAGAVRWPAWATDAPRLARGVLGRLVDGHWDTTPANAWGRLAFEAFGDRFEAVAVSGTSDARLDGDAQTFDWSRAESEARFAWPWLDAPARLALTHHGAGRPWAFVAAAAPLPLREPLAAGYRIQRRVTPVEQRVAGRWSRGDVAEIHVTVDAQADMTWVVVDDPVPAGARIIGSGLGRDPGLLAPGATGGSGAWPAWVERRADAYRAYYRWLPKGRFDVGYRIRFDTPGRYGLPPTRVEAMYAPEMFGEWPNAAVEVDTAP